MDLKVIAQLAQLGAAGAVILVVWLFLKSNTEWGKRQDKEREAFMEEIRAMRKAHSDELKSTRTEFTASLKEFSDTMKVVALKCPGPASVTVVESGKNGRRVGAS